MKYHDQNSKNETINKQYQTFAGMLSVKTWTTSYKSRLKSKLFVFREPSYKQQWLSKARSCSHVRKLTVLLHPYGKRIQALLKSFVAHGRRQKTATCTQTTRYTSSVGIAVVRVENSLTKNIIILSHQINFRCFPPFMTGIHASV